MLYSKLGNTGLVVSRLSLGTMTFADTNTSAVAKTDRKAADQLLGRALDAGVNFLDTANIYSGGDSETMLGEMIVGRRDALVIATKAGWRAGGALTQSGLSRTHLLWSVEQSLTRLNTDHVDVFIAHRDDANTPLEETLEALDTIVKHGKARYLGVSNWPAWKIAAAIELQRANGWAQFSHAQMMYSLVGRGIEEEVVPMMARYGLGITAWSPLAGGFLSGKYSWDTLKDPENRLSGFDFIPFDKERGFALVERMRALGEGHGASVAQVALAWVLSKPVVSSVILGVSKLFQLDDNLAAADLDLSPEELAELDGLSAETPRYPATVIGMLDQPIRKALAARPGAGFRPDPLQVSWS